MSTQDQEPVDVDRGRARHVHDLPRQQHRQRGDPGDPALAAPQHRRAGVGGQRLHPGVRLAAARRWPPGRRVRPPAAVPHRSRHLHRRVLRGRHRQRLGRADRRPRGAGPRRRTGHPDHAGDHHRDLPRQAGARRRDRRLERGRRARPSRRSAARRADQPAPVVGLDLLHQRPGRPGHDGPRRLGDQRVARGGRPAPARPARHRDVRPRPARPDLRADRGPRPRLDLAADPRLVRAGGRRRARRSCSSRDAPTSRWWPCRCSASGSSPAARSRC